MKTQSSELMRVAVEKSRNEQRRIDWLKRSAKYRYEKVKERMDAYRDKQAVTHPQDGLNIAQASSENMLLKDKDYVKWVNERNEEDRAYFDSLDKDLF